MTLLKMAEKPFSNSEIYLSKRFSFTSISSSIKNNIFPLAARAPEFLDFDLPRFVSFSIILIRRSSKDVTGTPG